jgi:hypothetical protein
MISERLTRLPALISEESLLRMFLYSDYKNGISHSSSSEEFPQEIIFQDLCAVSSM